MVPGEADSSEAMNLSTQRHVIIHGPFLTGENGKDVGMGRDGRMGHSTPSAGGVKVSSSVCMPILGSEQLG